MIPTGGTWGRNMLPGRGMTREEQWGWTDTDVTGSLGNEDSD